MILMNLRKLNENMKEKDWMISCFDFKYKNCNYIVLVNRFKNTEIKKDKYALVKLNFLVENDFNNELEIEANSSNFIINDMKKFRDFFKIEFGENLGCILSQFTLHFSTFIPSCCVNRYSDLQKSAMIKSLSTSDSENPNKIYCNSIKRNANNGIRSVYNSDKTKLLRPKLYEKFSKDKTISFNYFCESEKESTDDVIISNFSKSNINFNKST